MITVFIQNSTSTIGAGLTGLSYNSAGLVWNYFTEDASGTTSVTLATMTLGTWATGGFVQVSSAGLPGFYEIGLPNALTTNTTTTRSWGVMQLSGAANMVPVNVEIQFTGWNPASTNISANVLTWDGLVVTTQGGYPLVTPNLPTVLGANVLEWNGAVLPVGDTSGYPSVDVWEWNGTAVVNPNVGGVPVVDVVDWLGTAVTSAAGVPITTNTGTVTATVPSLSTNVNVTEWLGTAVTSHAGIPVMYSPLGEQLQL